MLYRHPLTGLLLGTCLVTAGAQASPAGEADASPAAVTTAEIPEVVVIGEKTRKNQFDTATSVTVFRTPQSAYGGHRLSAKDLLENSVNIVDLGNDNNLPAVRGVDGSGPATGAVAFLAGTRPRLNLSIDGRSATYNEFAFGTQSVWDMKQVEVLRGPQSHIQGRNAAAGTVVMQSQDPTDSWEGAVKLSAGNQKGRQAAAVVSGPLLQDSLSFRLSADRQQRESFIELPAYEPAGNPRRVETTTARAKLLFTPQNHPGFFSRFTVNHIDSRAPQSETLNNPNSARYAPERPVFETGSTSGIWDISWKFSENAGFENKLIYTRYRNKRLSLPAPAGVPADLEGREWQWEPLLRFHTPQKHIKGLVGLHLFHAEQDETVELANRQRNVYRNVFKDRTGNRAVFGEATWSAHPQLDLTLTGRWEREKHERAGGTDLFRIDRNKTHTVFLPKIELAWKPGRQWNTGFKIGRGYNSGGAGVTFGTPYVSYEYKPEYVWNYEWFGRYRSADKRWSVNSNVFFNDYKDMQLPFYLGPNSVVIRNADKVRTYGAEIGAEGHISSKLTVSGALGLLKTRIKRYPNSGIEGKKLSRSPAYTAVLGASYAFGNGWETGGNIRFSGSYYSNAHNNETGKIKAYNQLNLYTAYNFKHGRISVYADNVLDSGKEVFIPAADRKEALVQKPRSVGVAAELKF